MGSYQQVRSQHFRPSPIFLGILALFITGGVLTWIGYGNVRFNVFLFVVAGWVVSLCLHEYFHAITAFRGGDRAVAQRGYLTLDPLKYAHPLLSIVIPLAILVIGGFALPGGAVWVDSNALRSKAWDSLVSFAGPAANLLFAVVLTAPFVIGLDSRGPADFWAGVAVLAFFQLMAAVLNLVPIPGVDGGNLIEPWLSPTWRRGFAHVAPYGMLILIALLFSPLGRFFLTAIAYLAYYLGLPLHTVDDGMSLFRFWT